ncbi:hypothetical protein TNCV_4124511 [Trichonephila clavipes]|nr:hypothetical protein TNCV_4124511 [Trichonephila clavipes]
MEFRIVDFSMNFSHQAPNLSFQQEKRSLLHVTPQTVNFNESQAPHQRLYYMGLRTQYQSRCPKID